MPFAGDISSTANGTLLLSIVAAVLYAFMHDGIPSWRRTGAKTAPVLLLALLSVTEGAPGLLSAGLIAGALGDAALSREGDRPFLAGLAAFLLSHLLYIALFLSHWSDANIFAAEPWRAAASMVLIAFCALMLRRLLPALQPAMRLPVLAYVAAITARGISAFGVSGFGVALGAALFIASDAILAIRKFLMPEASPHRNWAGLAVWILYYAAQLLIALAFLL